MESYRPGRFVNVGKFIVLKRGRWEYSEVAWPQPGPCSLLSSSPQVKRKAGDIGRSERKVSRHIMGGLEPPGSLLPQRADTTLSGMVMNGGGSVAVEDIIERGREGLKNVSIHNVITFQV